MASQFFGGLVGLSYSLCRSRNKVAGLMKKPLRFPERLHLDAHIQRGAIFRNMTPAV